MENIQAEKPSSGGAEATGSLATARRLAVISLATAALVAPKLALVRFTANILWCEYGPLDLLLVAAQDLALAALVAWGLLRLLDRPTRGRLFTAAVASTGLLTLLLLDERVRELWLQPTSLQLVQYGVDNMSDLRSGSDLFFKHRTGFGPTLKRVLAITLALAGLAWGALLLWPGAPGAAPVRRHRLLLPLLAMVLVIVSIFVPSYRYGVEDNIFIAPLVRPLRRPSASAAEDAQLAARFDQKPQPLATVLTGERLILRKAAPFENLVVVFLESVRWDGLGFDGEGEELMPNLMRFAREGLFARSRVSVPHSSKSAFSVLSGRYPYPDIEAKESASGAYPSIVRLLKSARGAQTFAFSSVFLGFENLDGLLAGAGIERRQEARDLVGSQVATGEDSSFGTSDRLLFEGSARALAASKARPFAAVLLTLAAHYPYLYPGKPEEGADDWDAYRRSLIASDEHLGTMREQFHAQGLDRNTLFVLVGDHGESFGEHGVFAHNSSVYDVELTTPLVFWSADGRLRHDEILDARHTDVAPTTADLMGLTGGVLPVQGGSLLRARDRDTHYASTFFDNVQLGLSERGRKYIHHPGDGRLISFELATDPREQHGVTVEGPERTAIVDRMRAFRAYQRRWELPVATPP